VKAMSPSTKVVWHFAVVATHPIRSMDKHKRSTLQHTGCRSGFEEASGMA